MSGAIRVLCVDDNPLVGAALERHLRRAEGLEWVGLERSADGLLDAVARGRPDVVVLDIDMPGADPFQAVTELAAIEPAVRIVLFSGHVRQEFIDRAIDSGAWGYVSKDDGEAALVDAIRQVHDGRFTLGSGVLAVLERRR